MDRDDYFWIKAKVNAVVGKVTHEALKDRSELELELDSNEFGIKKVDVAGMLPIEAGDMVRIGFEKRVCVGCFYFEGRTYKERSKEDMKQEMRADVVEKLKDGKVVASYHNYWG